MAKKTRPRGSDFAETDAQQPMTGKVENDFNKQGNQEPTQKHESNRTPHSRSDRESHIGSSNQNQSRRGVGTGGGAGGGR